MIQAIKNILKLQRNHFVATDTSKPKQEEFIDEHYQQAVQDLEKRRKERALRLEVIRKRRIYYNYFEIRKRYGISFKEFNRRVDQGVWVAYFAE